MTASAMIANIGGTISGTPNPIDIHQPFVPTRNKSRRTLAIMATTRRCSRQFVNFAAFSNGLWRQHNLGRSAGVLRGAIDTWGPPPLAKMTRLFFEMNETDIKARIADEGRVPLVPLVHVHELRERRRDSQAAETAAATVER